MKITRENQVILKRLQEKKPSYNVTKWAQEDHDRKKLLFNICEYPYALQNRQNMDDPAATLNPSAAADAYLNGPPDFIIKKQGNNRTGTQFYKKRGYTADSLRNQKGIRPTQSQGAH